MSLKESLVFTGKKMFLLSFAAYQKRKLICSLVKIIRQLSPVTFLFFVSFFLNCLLVFLEVSKRMGEINDLEKNNIIYSQSSPWGASGYASNVSVLQNIFRFREAPPKERILRQGIFMEIGCVIYRRRSALTAELPSPLISLALCCLGKAVSQPQLLWNSHTCLPAANYKHSPQAQQCCLSFCFSSCTNDSQTLNTSRIWRLVL